MFLLLAEILSYSDLPKSCSVFLHGSADSSDASVCGLCGCERSFLPFDVHPASGLYIIGASEQAGPFQAMPFSVKAN
ncbi:uncharacterized [Tachysurus ichikawai]